MHDLAEEVDDLDEVLNESILDSIMGKKRAAEALNKKKRKRKHGADDDDDSDDVGWDSESVTCSYCMFERLSVCLSVHESICVFFVCVSVPICLSVYLSPGMLDL